MDETLKTLKKRIETLENDKNRMESSKNRLKKMKDHFKMLKAPKVTWIILMMPEKGYNGMDNH